MTTQRFEGIMITLVPALVEAYAIKVGKPIREIIHDVYSSKLYSALENKETALWHLSPLLLANLIVSERTTGMSLLPEEQ